jgi:peptide/nickel transport system permease protein
MEQPFETHNEETMTVAEERISVASQRQLMWWRFRKHRLAMAAGGVLIVFYLIAIFCEFVAYADPHDTEAYRKDISPQPIRLFDEGRFSPHVFGMKGERDPVTWLKSYVPDPEKKASLRLFARGFEYELFGLIKTDRHLIGVSEGQAEDFIFLLGTDRVGRDLFSRLVFATRISLSIGLVGVTLSLFLGVLLGGISGYFGGVADTIIQRVIEVLRSIPTIPLWMGLAAALPRDWDIIRIYFAITIILSFIGWTGLAREVRGRFLTLREEDFVMAAELLGAGRLRVVFRHMVPSFLSHIIASTTLALPAMIIAETSLSFLGLGMQAPAISWGTLLRDSQNVSAIVATPWMLLPAVPVIVAILAFNFVGDGLRDAADPYAVA